MRGLFLLIFAFTAFTSYAQTDSSKNKGKDNGMSAIDSNERIYTVVEQMPEFPGGDEAMMKFIHKNLTYPEIAMKNGIIGTIRLRFIVRSTGEITDIEAVNKESLEGSGLEEEAIRVIKKMPKWTPGKQNGKPVSVYFNFPIRVELR